MSGQATTRQAANVTVAGRAQRYGSYKGGYQIINQSLNAIVWCADNPSVADGFGTPVNPGTSIVWATDGELFMCLGTDAQSVAAGSCDVILSYDVQNWQPNPIAIAAQVLNSGVLVVDRPERIYNNLLSSSTPLIDVSRFNTLEIIANCNSGSTFLNSGILLINWANDDGGVVQERITWCSATTGVTDKLYRGLHSIKGQYVSFEVADFITGGVDLAVSVSQRSPVSNVWNDGVSAFTAGSSLFAYQTVVPPTSNAPVRYIPPFFGKVMCYVACTQPGAVQLRNMAGQGVTFDAAYVSATVGVQGAYTFFGGYINNVEHTLFGNQVEVLMANTAAAPNTMSFMVLPVRTIT